MTKMMWGGFGGFRPLAMTLDLVADDDNDGESDATDTDDNGDRQADE